MHRLPRRRSDDSLNIMSKRHLKYFLSNVLLSPLFPEITSFFTPLFFHHFCRAQFDGFSFCDFYVLRPRKFINC